MENRPLADRSVGPQQGDRSIELTPDAPHSKRDEQTAEDGARIGRAAVSDQRSWYNGLLRWRYILPRALVATLVWAFFAYGFDPLVRYGLVAGGESVMGTPVDVELVQTQFFPPVFELRKVGITDPRRTDENAVTFDEIVLRVAGEPLLHREFVIEEAALHGLRINADRTTRGTLAEKKTSNDDGIDLGPLKRQIKLLGLQWYDELEAVARQELDPKSLETVQVAEVVEAEWKVRIAQMKRRMNELQQRIDTVREATHTKGDPLKQLDVYSQTTKEVQSILQEAQQIRIDVRDLPAIARQDVQRLDSARQRDTQRLQQRINSLPLNPTEISKSLLGPQLAERLAEVNHWVGWIKRYASADAIDVPDPQSRGERIVFPRTQQNPTFVVKALSFSGVATKKGQPFAIAGECRGLSSNPALYGRPTDWRFEIAGPDPISIVGNSDLTTSEPLHEIAFNWQAHRPVSQSIGDLEKFAITLSAGSAQCDGWLRIDGDKLEGEVHMSQTPLTVNVNESAGEFARQWVAPALTRITTADATLQLYGTLGNLDWQVQSDIGPQIASGFHQLIVGQIESQRAKLLTKVESVARDQTKKLPSMANDQVQFLLADLTSRESRAKEAVAKLSDGKLDIRKVSTQIDFNRILRR